MKKTIIFIHGMWVNGSFWDNYVEKLSDDYDCIAITLPKHKKSSKKINFSFGDYAYYCESEIEDLNLKEKPIIIGHSMGGLIALALAERGVAAKAVCLSPAIPSGIFSLNFHIIKTFSKRLLRWRFWGKLFEPDFKDFKYIIAHLMSSEEQRKIFDSMVRESGKVVFQIGFWFLDPKRSTRIKKINCPALIISGTQDRIIPISAVKKTAKKYQTDFKEFKNHAHLITKEPDWEEVLKSIKNWLK